MPADCRNEQIARFIDKVEAHERFTLELGSGLVLFTLGLGLQIGQWSIWSVPLALAAYLAWVIAYSEVAVQDAKRRAAIAAKLQTATRRGR